MTSQALTHFFIVTFACISVLATSTPAARAQSDPVSEVYALVNVVRADYGLAPYRFDSALALAAQRHSEWGLSVGYFSHEGADGSRPTDRAVAAGYGGYGEVRVSENIYWGTSATPDSAVTWWRNSAIHLAGMTSATYQDIGVGVAYGDTGGYFTLLFGVHTASVEAAPAPPPSAGGAQNPPAPPVEDVPEIPEIATAAPHADGSIIHTVEEGQAIWNIAAAYEVPVLELLALNSLSDGSLIQIGTEIIVRPANTPAPPATPTLPPTATRPPTLTPIVADIHNASRSGMSEAVNQSALSLASDTHATLRTSLLAALLIGAGMVIVGFVGMRARAKI